MKQSKNTYIIWTMQRPQSAKQIADSLMDLIVKFYTEIEPNIMESNNYKQIDKDFMKVLNQVDTEIRESAKKIPLPKSDNRQQNGV